MQNRSLAKILFALLLIALILFSFVAFIQKHKWSLGIDDPDVFSLKEISLKSNEHLDFPSSFSYLPISLYLVEFNPLENIHQNQLSTNSTRAQIFNFVKANPGVSFREICSSLGIAVGSAQFHLGVLKKAGLLSFFRDGKYKRFFEARKFSRKRKALISLLRHKTTEKIVEILLDHKSVSHSILASMLNISSQGLTWNINRLRKTGILQEIRRESRVHYSLDSKFLLQLSEIKSNHISNLA